LNASNDSLREEAASSQNRLERTVAALRIAGSNAAKARGDADTAQATATGLAQSLQSLQTVVTETKRASQVLHQDQQQVSTAATSIQAKLLQKEADLARAQKEMLSMRTSQKRLESSHQRWKEERSDLQFTLDDQKQGLLRLGHGMAERDAVERARKERADQIELEWREAQAMLVQATAGQAAAEQTQALLKQSILELHAANKQLHEQAWGQQEASRKEKERLHEALTKAEKQAQQLRIRGEATEEDMQRLRLDKTAAEKQVSQLKTRLAGLERRLKDAGSTTMVSPDAMNESTHVSPPNNNESSTGIALGTGLGFSLPPLSGSSRLALVGGGQDNSNDNAPVPAKCCSICFKAAFGLMQSCQCGKPDCDKRAHLSCMNKIKPGPSVSHPGTPAPRLPLVLCAATATASRSSSSTDTAATGIASN
jgi:predicted nuclease with TOPRIM domain